MTALAAGVAGFLGSWALLDLAGRLARRPRVPRGRRPAGALALLGPLRRLVAGSPEQLGLLLDSAQLPGAIDSRFVMGVKASLATVGGAFAFVAAALSDGRTALALLGILPVAGFLAPDLVLRRRARAVHARVLAEVPQVAERLHLALSSGLSPARAAGLASRGAPGPLAGELARAAALSQAGAPLPEALDRVVRRCPAAEVVTLVAALVRCHEQGAEISSLLLGVAGAARRHESLRLRDRAQKAAPKIQLAVALLLVPAALSLIAAALVSGLLGR